MSKYCIAFGTNDLSTKALNVFIEKWGHLKSSLGTANIAYLLGLVDERRFQDRGACLILTFSISGHLIELSWNPDSRNTVEGTGWSALANGYRYVDYRIEGFREYESALVTDLNNALNSGGWVSMPAPTWVTKRTFRLNPYHSEPIPLP